MLPNDKPAPLQNVSDTARLVAYYRAIESERPDALFRDPFARELAGAKGKEIAESLPFGKRAAPGVAIRTQVIDELLYRLIREGSVDMAVNLASGLDARAYRMELPASFIWVEADLPEINAFKTAKMELKIPRCELERIDVDLSQSWARTQFFDHLKEKYANRKAVVITEGLLMYLEELNVLALTEAVNDFAPAAFWIQDFFSPTTLKWGNRLWGRQLREAHAQFRFAPPNGAEYMRPYGWTPLDVRSALLERSRLKRGGGFAKFIYDLSPPAWQHRMRLANGIALLRRTR